MFGQNKHDCLKICNQLYIFFYAMAAAPPDVYRCHHYELCYDDVERLHYDVGTNFSILCGESGPSNYRALHFNRPVNKFPPNSSVTLEGGKLIIRVEPSDELSPPSKYCKQADTPIKDNVNNIYYVYMLLMSSQIKINWREN